MQTAINIAGLRVAAIIVVCELDRLPPLHFRNPPHV